MGSKFARADPAIYPETLWHDARVGYGITNRARFHLYSRQHFEGADGHNWQLSKAQRQLLQRYYDANLLLVNCLNSDCYVSREVRQEMKRRCCYRSQKSKEDRLATSENGCSG